MTKAKSWITMPLFLRSVRLRSTRFHPWPLRYQWHPAGTSRRQSPFGPARGAEPSGSGPAAFHNNCLWTWGLLHTAPAVNRHRFLTLMPDASLLIEREARTWAARAVGDLPRGARGLREGHRLSFVRAGRPPPEIWRCPFVRNTAPCMSEPEAPGYQVGNEQQVDTGGPDGRCKGADSEYARSPISR